ncbi:SRPBCC family protein [Methylibium rhizosphaerae]|uniref:SRPBCC family protein n=1 Tax=Methylibium rhizosphaerae TaxID=2570323 RepID=UPI001125CE7C
MPSSQIRSRFPRPAAVVWDYLLHLKDCERWMPAEELHGVALLFDSGRYAGFQWAPDKPGVAPIVSRVQRIDPCRSVQYRTVCATESNVPPSARAGFPFRSMKQSMVFNDSGSGCELVQHVELEPNGLLGWLTCSLLLLPSVKRGVVESHRRLAELLREV